MNSQPASGGTAGLRRPQLLLALLTLLLASGALALRLPDTPWRDLWLVACGALACMGWSLTRRRADSNNSGSRPADAVTVERLTIAARAAGTELWELDPITLQRVWVENRQPGLGLEHVPLESYMAALEQCMDPAEAQRIRTTIREALESTSTAFSYRFRIARPDGTTRHFQDCVTVLRHASGAPARLFGATTDVTAEAEMAASAQQRAEESRLLHDRLYVATTAAGMEVWEFDLRARKFLFVHNRIAVLGLRDTPIEDYGAALGALVPPEDQAHYTAIVAAAARGGEHFCTYGFRVVRDGATYHMRCYANIVRDAAGRAQRLLGASVDVTNEVQSTELLKSQAEQQSALVDRLHVATRAAGIASWELDLKTSKFLWRENWQITRSEGGASVEVLDQIVHPDDRDHFLQALQKARETGSDLIDYRHRIISGGRVWHMQNHARLFRNARGNPVRALGVSWDVSKEVAATELIREQTHTQRKLLERLGAATQAAGIMCWELDFKTQKIVWQENFSAEFIAAADGDLLAELQRRTHPDDRNAFNNGLREALRNKSDLMTYRYRATTPEGRQIHRQCYARLFSDADRKLTHALGVTWDITKEVEAAGATQLQAQHLAEVERRLERASLSSSEGHFEWDLVSGKAWYSSSCHALLGYRPGELPDDMTSSLQMLQRPEDVAWQAEKYAAHIAQGAAYDYETQLRTASGELRWFRIRGIAERDAAQKPLLLAGSLHDVHQQKLTEDALKQVQQRLERAIHGTQDGLWELDRDGSAWLSPRLAELLGYGADELPSDANFMRDFLHPGDEQAVTAATQAHFEQALPYDVEIRLRTRAQGYRWYRARAAAERDSNGRPARLSGSLQDVTEARTAREELLQAITAAEEANRAKSTFLANVSHEIRTPMNGIIGMTGLILDTTLDRSQRDYAETIRSSADSLLTVINDILDFSKIEAGKLDIECREMDLHGSVDDVVATLAFQAMAKDLELIVDVHPELPKRVIGDPQRIRQCLVNLVGNAIKFTRTGEVAVEVRAVSAPSGVPMLQFEVRDTGIGIPADTLQSLFQPFVQADSSTTRYFGGTGLGLSIVRRLVDMMSGDTGVESEVGKGSRFWFRLPLIAPATAGEANSRPARRTDQRILVVEDNATAGRVLSGHLRHAGYRVDAVGSGADALVIMRAAQRASSPFAAVLCDFEMPEMDGLTFGKQINSDPSLSGTRVVMLSPLDRHGESQQLGALGFAGYLTKPVRSRELLSLLDRVLTHPASEWHLRTQPVAVPSAPRETQPVKPYAARVLLVEDNLVNQKVAVRFLERLGCSVRVAENGEVAVAACADDDFDFDIVLMDLQMPVMDGFTATARIRQIEQGERRLPIVALTANAISGRLEECLAAGMDGFLSKPIQLPQLQETLDRFGLRLTA